mgnify:CR=1 FL=1
MKEIYLIILAVIGFLVSFYLYYTKTHNKKIHCISKHGCDAVVKSKYGQTFGVENTLFGMLYYLMIFAYGIAILFDRNLFKPNIIYYLIVASSAASVLYSIYLTGVQAFVLKKWCDYCIVSSITSVLILIVLVV